MWDKIVIAKKVGPNEADTIIRVNHLEECARGEIVYYQSTAYGNFENIFIHLKDGRVQVKCSLHKVWAKLTTGLLDNSRRFTMTDARVAIVMLLKHIGASDEGWVVSYFEIGLNIRLELEPIWYIEKVVGIGQEDGTREMFNDANWVKHHQLTTERSRNYKKVMKIYDKTWEAREKRRIVDDNVLRVETIYKRQKVPLAEFRSEAFSRRLASRFAKDWLQLEWQRYMQADKGMKQSQIDKARRIIEIGVTAYLEECKRQFMERRMTKKAWETCRTFARSWPEMKDKFMMIESPHEREYRLKFKEEIQILIN